jgi:UDP:flavonoid glycosyltransferase YjiC (YdhE family)
MSAMHRIYRRDGLPALNRGRCGAGLAPLRTPFEQYDRATRVLLLSCAAFEFPAVSVPDNVRYVGTPFDDIGACWHSPWPPEDARPLVVVSLSTLPQGQEPLLQRVVSALATLPVRALVTLGPAIERTRLVAPANVALERFVPHSAVLANADVLVTQCGFGGVTKALAHGVPMLCLPLVGDQPDNAARGFARGAGVLLKPHASSSEIHNALTRLLADPRFKTAARRLGASLDGDHTGERAALELESLASPMPCQVRA